MYVPLQTVTGYFVVAYLKTRYFLLTYIYSSVGTRIDAGQKVIWL